MPTPKTITSKSRTTSSKNSTGRKVTRSTGKSRTVSKSSSPRSRTQKSLEEKTKSLSSSPKAPKKTGKTSGTTAKAKAKTTTKGTISTSKKQQKKPSVKRTTRQNSKDRGVKHTRCAKIELFPVNCMPWRLEPRTGKFNLSWYMCFDHAVDQIERSNLKPRDYKLMCYTSVPLTDPLTGE